MSVQRIDIPASRTHGWQVRAYVTEDWRMTKFFSDSRCGGHVLAYVMADEYEAKLIELARRKRKALRLGVEGRG